MHSGTDGQPCENCQGDFVRGTGSKKSVQNQPENLPLTFGPLYSMTVHVWDVCLCRLVCAYVCKHSILTSYI